jgi:sugar/nucleoside kinase (ribokinase family)
MTGVLEETSRYEVLLSGTYFCDLIFTGLPEMPRLGAEIYSGSFDIVPGGAFSAARSLHRLGVRTGWPCDFGSDMFSHFVLQSAYQDGMDVSLFRQHDYPVRSITVALSFPHERSFVSYVDPIDKPDLVPLVHQFRPRCVFLMGLNTGPKLIELCSAAHQVGAFVFMDCQSHNTALDDPQVTEALQAVDIFAPNAAEALQLTGEVTVAAAVHRLAALTPLVVVKQGGEGAVAQAGERSYHSPALEGVCVRDTTGAGDCFNAGFLSAYLKGSPLENCLRFGNICGGLSTTDLGGRSAPGLIEVEQWLNQERTA